MPQLIGHAEPATDGGGHRRTREPQLGERTDAEDEQGVQHDVDRVGHHQGTHGHGRIARTTEHRVDDEQPHDHHVAAEEDAGVADPGIEHGIAGAHGTQDVVREHEQGDAQHQADGQCHPQALHRRDGGTFLVLLPGPSGHHRGDPHAEAPGDGVDHDQHALGEPHRGHGRRTDAPHEEHIDQGEQALHAELEHHGDAQQHDGPAHAHAGVVPLGIGEAFADQLEELLHGGGQGTTVRGA